MRRSASGRSTVLVNNAGIMSIGAFVDEDDETSRRMLEINAYGVLVGTRLAASRMAARGEGHIVNVASTAGRVGFAGGATYCATKFFVVGLSEALHAELRDSGVKVSCILPGLVDTELVAGLKVPRFVRATPPEAVAEAVVEAVPQEPLRDLRAAGHGRRQPAHLALPPPVGRGGREGRGRRAGALRARSRGAPRRMNERVKQEAD